MQGTDAGFVKLYARKMTGIIVGAVVVAPNASELIFPLTMAIQRGLTVARMSRRQSGYTRRCQDLSPRPPAG